VKQLFGKAGWQDEKSDFDISYAWADTSLIGNGAAPESLLAVHESRSIPFRISPTTSSFRECHGSHFLQSDLLLSANAYYRHLSHAQTTAI